MTLMIGNNSVVSIHYTLKNEAGDVIDSSEDNQPLVYLHSSKNLIPGLESELHGKSSGASFSTVIPPQQAYGEVRTDLIKEISKDLFQGVESVEAGMTFLAHGEDGAEQQVRVTAVSGDEVMVDANHPMAGMTLHFEVEIVDVREGTEQEIEHGHVHQPGADH